MKTPARGRRFVAQQTEATRRPPFATRIVFIALLSIWRIRSADTPYSSARSCSVAVESSSRSQRASMMRRLRASSFASAVCRPVAAVARASRASRGSARARPRCPSGRRSARRSFPRPPAPDRARRRGPDRRVSISTTSSGLTPRSLAMPWPRDRQRGRARLHAAQVEEELALRLGRRDLDQPPVAQDVLVHLGADPVQRERHQADAALGIEAADRLHEADIAFLDQVGLRQPIAQVIAATRPRPAAGATAPAAGRRRGRSSPAGAGRAPSPAPRSAAGTGSRPGYSDRGSPARPGSEMPAWYCVMPSVSWLGVARAGLAFGPAGTRRHFSTRLLGVLRAGMVPE